MFRINFCNFFNLYSALEAQRSSSGHVLNVESEHSTTKEPIDLIQQFFYSLNPIDEEEWLNGNKCIKTVMLIKSPVIVALRTLIPIVDYELDDCGWTKLLNCLHILLLPTFMIYFMCKFSILLFGIESLL